MAFSSLATPSSSRFSKFLMKKWNNKLDTLVVWLFCCLAVWCCVLLSNQLPCPFRGKGGGKGLGLLVQRDHSFQQSRVSNLYYNRSHTVSHRLRILLLFQRIVLFVERQIHKSKHASQHNNAKEKHAKHHIAIQVRCLIISQ